MATDAPAPPAVGTVEEYREAPFDRRRAWAGEADVGRIVGPEVDHHLVTHPEHVRAVLVDDEEAYLKPSGVDMYGAGLLGVSGEQWRAQRAAVQGAFRPPRVRSYAEAFHDAALDLVGTLEDGETVDVWDLATDATRRLLLRSLFGDGADPEAIARAGEPIRAWFRAVLTSGAPPEGMQADYERGLERLREHVEGLVAEGGTDDDTVLSALVEEGERRDVGYTDERLRDEVITLLFSAHERIAATLAYACYLLSGAPRADERLAAELAAASDGVRAAVPDGEREAASDGERPAGPDLQTLPYARCVVDETLRLYCPSEAVFRQARTDTELGGYAISEGDVVCLSQWDVHRDERWWSEPLAFRPERFEGDANRPRFAFFPFGGGRHRCPGETFTRVAVTAMAGPMLRAFSFDRVTDDLDLRAGQTVVPTGPVELVARSRG